VAPTLDLQVWEYLDCCNTRQTRLTVYVFLKQVIGKTGKVISVDSDGDVKVDFGGAKWTFNPQCCTLVSQGQGRVPSARASVTVNTQSSDDDDGDDDDSGNRQ